MMQDERWMVKYNEVKGFIERNKRNSLKFEGSERGIRIWIKHQRKLLNASSLKEDKVE